MDAIIVREGEKLTLDRQAARNGMVRRLMQVSDASPFPIFSYSRGVLRAGRVVGTVTCGHVRIEIHPKTVERDGTQDREFLLNLLRFSGHLRGYHWARGSVPQSTAEPIEILIAEIADDISAGLREGVPQRYQNIDAEIPTIRGRVNLGRLSTRLPTQHAGIPVRHAPLTIDNHLSRLIKWVAQTLLRVSRSVRTQEKLRAAINALRMVDLRGFSASEVHSLELSRFESGWQPTLTLARLLLEGSSFNPTLAGRLDAIAVVFSLERLFERCLRQLLPAALPDAGFSVSHRTDTLYMLTSRERGDKAVRIRPDFIYRKDKRAVAVADAKWKRLSHDSVTFGLTPADVYQVSAYLLRYQLRHALLLFPKTEWMPGSWSSTYDIPGTGLVVQIVGVDIESLVSPHEDRHQEALRSLRTLVAFHLTPSTHRKMGHVTDEAVPDHITTSAWSSRALPLEPDQDS